MAFLKTMKAVAAGKKLPHFFICLDEEG